MGSVGDAYDNAMAESFFATLECELLDRRSFKTQVEARMAIFEFIEGFYNPRRRHSSIGYRSPIVFERQYAATAPKPGAPERAAVLARSHWVSRSGVGRHGARGQTRTRRILSAVTQKVGGVLSDTELPECSGGDRKRRTGARHQVYRRVELARSSEPCSEVHGSSSLRASSRDQWPDGPRLFLAGWRCSPPRHTDQFGLRSLGWGRLFSRSASCSNLIQASAISSNTARCSSDIVIAKR
jgi:hypothetical protein